MFKRGLFLKDYSKLSFSRLFLTVSFASAPETYEQSNATLSKELADLISSWKTIGFL